MYRPHHLTAAVLVGSLIFTADAYSQQPSQNQTLIQPQGEAQNRRQQRQEERNQGTRQNTQQNTEVRKVSGEKESMEFKYDKVAQLKDQLLDSNLIRQATDEYENNKDKLAKEIACEIVVQVLSEDLLFVSALKEKMMSEKVDQASRGEMQEMHQRIMQQKEMLMNDQKEYKEILSKVVMRCKVEEKLLEMMEGDGKGRDQERQARMQDDRKNN